MEITATVSKWGNSNGIRLPVEILKKANINFNDKLFFDVDSEGRIILTKAPTPKVGTLEYLFRNYEGGSFKTEVIDLDEPVGNERW